MERQKVQRTTPPAYPTCAALPAALARRLALAAALAAAPLAACDLFPGHVDGLMADPSENWGVSLPAKGTHTTVFPDAQGELDYHLGIEVRDEVIDCLSLEPELRLAEADAVLHALPLAIFAGEGELSEVEDALDEAFSESCGVPAGYIADLELYVDAVRLAEEPDTGEDTGSGG